jgi:NhaP-type Na+/H+ or K+/H+ antiporter
MGTAIVLTWVEDILHGTVHISALLGVMAMGFMLLEKQEAIAHIISSKLKRLWVFAELLLFVLVGAQVDVGVAWKAGVGGVLLICAGLAARSVGTWVSLTGSGFDSREKLFAVVSYIPKATVQAAIGAVPLAAGLPGGEVILAVAVLSILLTAPAGAIGIKFLGERILAESSRSPYSFKELREKLGLPRVGARVLERSSGKVWKVIEEKETWFKSSSAEQVPTVILRVWEPIENAVNGQGPTRYLKYTPSEEPFTRKWEIVYD